jgi:ribosomal protein S19
MIRSLWKGPYINTILYNEIIQYPQLNNFETNNRSSTIIDNMIHKIIKIYNGKSYVSLDIKENMIGYKLGEFIQTKKRCIYRNKKGKKKK